MSVPKALFALLLAVPLGGCNLDSMFEKMFTGTSKGFAYCESIVSTQGLTKQAVRQFCAKRHEKTIADFNGRAGWDRGLKPTFSGVVINNSSNFIVTGYTITVGKKGGNPFDGSRREFSGKFVEPGQSDLFVIQNDELSTIPVGSDLEAENTSWGVVALRGIEISF